MAYTLAAFIAGPEAAAVLAQALGVRPVALEQGLELVPVHRAGDADASQPSSFGSDLWWLTADAEDAATRAAGREPVVYAEAEYFGGTGEQHAVLWQDGSPRLLASELPGAVNAALRCSASGGCLPGPRGRCRTSSTASASAGTGAPRSGPRRDGSRRGQSSMPSSR